MPTIKNAVFAYSLLTSLLLLGCMPQSYRPSSEPVSSTVNHYYDKNYELNKKQTIYIGESIIKSKDYYASKRYVPQLTPSMNFTVTSTISISFNKNDTYQSAGNVRINNRKYTVVPSRETFLGSTLGILVNENGSISPYTASIRNGNVVVNENASAKIIPSGAKMERGFEEVVSSSKGYTNHELIFSGIDKDTLTVTYREYTQDDLARPAFFQTLTYRSDSKTIRYKRYKIAIHHVNGESMTYSVLEEPSAQ